MIKKATVIGAGQVGATAAMRLGTEGPLGLHGSENG